jgi:hypothetical protein
VYGYSKEYELNIVDLEGNLVTRIKKDESYQNFTAQERETYKESKLPKHRPFFYFLSTDSEGRIYVLRNSLHPIYNAESDTYRYIKELEFDIFSQDGYYLYRTTLDLAPVVIQDGYFYTTSVDKEEDLVKRYKIKNWNKIKKEK